MFTLDKTLTEDLTKPFEQYHKKELFESRAFSMERVRITRRADGAPKTWEFAKTKGADADKWQVTPEGGQAADADPAKVDALLNALAALRLGAFAAPAARTGLDAPVLSRGGQLRRRQVRARARRHRGRSLLRQSRGRAGDRRAGQDRRGRGAPGARRGAGSTGAAHRSGGGTGQAVRILGGERAVILTLVTALAAGACSSRARSAPPAPPPSSAAATPPGPAVAAPAGPGAAAAPGFAAPANPALAPLHNALSTIFGRGSVDHAQLAVSIKSLTTGETLFALNERRMMVPASNQKLLTVAAAARRLGWNYRYTTRVLATGPVKADGTLDGDLVVVGSGDPTINPRHPDRWAVLDDWAGQIAARGVKVVNGHLIGDDNAFAEPGLGSGWSWDDLVTGYGSPIGALQYNENQVELLVGPGMEAGASGIVSMSPLGSGLLVDNQVKYRRRGSADARDHRARAGLEHAHGPRPGGDGIASRGCVFAAVENPTTLFVNAFREALSRKGIFVGGSALDIDDVRTAPDLSKAETWVTDQSPPLFAIVDPLLKRSRNGYAETLLWTMSPPGEPANEVAGLKVLRETLTELGVDPALYASFDGSGLSRYDMLTAESLIRVLTTIWNDPLMLGPYRSALPVAGHGRFHREPPEGHAGRGPRVGQDRFDVQHQHAVRLRAHRG